MLNQIEDMLKPVEEGRTGYNFAYQGSNSYSHYKEELRNEIRYVKIGCVPKYATLSEAIQTEKLKVTGKVPGYYEKVNIKRIPIRIYRYDIKWGYTDRTIVDFHYDQEEDQLNCLGIAVTVPKYTEFPTRILETKVMTEEEMIRSGIGPVKLKSL